MKELSFHGVDFRIGRLNVFEQFDVSRRIGPFAPALAPVFREIAKHGTGARGADDGEAQPVSLGAVDDVLKAAQPFLDALARMSNEDSRFVISTCLSVVMRKQGQAWSPLVRDGVFMFDDLDLSSVGPLVVAVIKDNLGPFFSGWLTAQTTPAPTKAA